MSGFSSRELLVCLLVWLLLPGCWHVSMAQREGESRRSDSPDKPPSRAAQSIITPSAPGASATEPTLSLPADTLGYIPSYRPSFRSDYRFGNPYIHRVPKSSLVLKDPGKLDHDVLFEDGSVRYRLRETLGGVDLKPPTLMSFNEYDTYHDRKIVREYLYSRSQGEREDTSVGGRRLIPRIYVSPVLDRIFGGSYVDIVPTGYVNIDFGGFFQYIDNPQVNQKQRKTSGFNFDMAISTNVVGKVGDKLELNFNFDNNQVFSFQNDLKVTYTGYDEDIIKKIEVGTVSMPVRNSLISGAQSLFGAQAQLQFGKFYITGTASRQTGKNEVLTLSNSGGNVREFEIRASGYDENKHFFLGHFFRDNYQRWLSQLPQPVSGINIVRLEVYVLNRTNETQKTRNFLSLIDIGESDHLHNPNIGGVVSGPSDNSNNELFDLLTSDPGFRAVGDAPQKLASAYQMVESSDYVVVTTGRKLDPEEYSFHRELGYVTLQHRIRNDEVLAVSFEYTFNGQRHKVGELVEDYQGLDEDQLIILKMLRPNKVDVTLPTWDLMMKNVYNLNSGKISREAFELRVHYRDDATGIDNPSLHEGTRTKDEPLLRLFNLDSLNPNLDRQEDGNFDFIEGVTVNGDLGLIIFPVVEPFGSTLESYFDPVSEAALIDKYVFDDLYRTTKADAELVTRHNKYYLLGSLSGGGSSEISLPGIKIAEGSVTVNAGGTPLTEGIDYQVNYYLGRVTITNDSILSSGKSIQISYEKEEAFGFNVRWLTGLQMEYKFNENLSLGATALHLKERQGFNRRPNIGEEPTDNRKYGVNLNYKTDLHTLTKWVDKLPLISTREVSTLSVDTEAAMFRPGTSNIVQGSGAAYIDDFEESQNFINLRNVRSWRLSSVPSEIFDGQIPFGLSSNYQRAKLAWYTIDNTIFYRNGNARPSNISDQDLLNHYVRPIYPQDVFKQQDRPAVVQNQPTMDLAFFPSERGPNNYNTDLDPQGLLRDQKKSWAGISRSFNNVDFDRINAEYIEFWMMDPFIGHSTNDPEGVVHDGIFNENNTSGGQMVFNLGSVSEDVLMDGKHSFENGLPPDGDLSAARMTTWGFVPTTTFLTPYFVNDSQSRKFQDVGFDGLWDEQERTHFDQTFLSRLNVPPATLEAIREDPSADNFRYYLDPYYDREEAKILQRYKQFNGQDGNSPVSGTGITRASSVYPDNEDVNEDNTISSVEQYYEYKVELRPGELQVGENHIVDRVAEDNGTVWYLFRVPVRDPDRIVGDIGGYKTIKFIRMYLKGFEQPVVLRFLKFQITGSKWRKYREPLNEAGLNEIPESTQSELTVSTVNVEENSIANGDKSSYVIPPGLQRDRDTSNAYSRRLNESSLQICVENLPEQDGRGVYRNISVDLVNYGRIRMYFHAEPYQGQKLEDGDIHGFLRLGTDNSENYFEIEVPLTVTQGNFNLPSQELRRFVWPKENELDIRVEELLALKAERNRLSMDTHTPYRGTTRDGKYFITVQGRPDISNVVAIMIGVRNPASLDKGTKSACIWANELRVAEFNRTPGYAANTRMSLKVADLGKINLNTRYQSIGFGGIQQRIGERSRAEVFEYDVSAQLGLEKFLWPARTGLHVPMYVSRRQIVSTPQYDPLDPDTELETSVLRLNEKERESYIHKVQERTVNRSLNFSGVRKEKVNKESKSLPFDLSNLTLNYAFSDRLSSNETTQGLYEKNQSGGVNYTYSPNPLILSPFANSEWASGNYLKFIRDINFSLYPEGVQMGFDLDRRFISRKLYNEALTSEGVEPYYERRFNFNRNYRVGWNLFKSLSTNFQARTTAIIDEPEDIIEGDIDTPQERNYIWKEILSLGRMKTYNHSVSLEYGLPFSKFPVLDWVDTRVNYQASYEWRAGSLSQEDESGNFFGHSISNTRNRGMKANMKLRSLYDKLDYLKEINAGSGSQTSEAEKGGSSLNFGQAILRVLMSVRDISVETQRDESTRMAGFLKTAYILGLDSGLVAPGSGFIFGSQDPGIRHRAAGQGWLTRSSQLTDPFRQTDTRDLSVKATAEPFQHLRIQLEASRRYSTNFQEIFRYSDTTADYESLTPSGSGSYTVTLNTIRTSFGDPDDSESFREFINNIDILQQRWTSSFREKGLTSQYRRNSQDVLIPAFLAAYTGTDANEVALSPLPRIPKPSWRVDYSGLSKIPALKEIFSSFSITHAYRSQYSIDSYTNSLSYTDVDGDILDYPDPGIVDDKGFYIPVYIINQVSISEQYSPLIGINVRTNNNATFRIDYKKSRNLTLQMSNLQVAENVREDWSFEAGIGGKNIKLPFRVRGSVITIESDIGLVGSFSIGSNRTFQRRISGESTETAGSRSLRFRTTLRYGLMDNLDLNLYYERSKNDPVVGSFLRRTTSIGAQLRFDLAGV